MVKVISICNQKGGVGKTTTAVNIASFLATKIGTTLLVDLDPQANATSGCGIPKSQIHQSVYDVLTEGVPASAVVQKTRVQRLFVLPADTSLAGAEVELVSQIAREHRLKEALKEIRDLYDYIIIDTPPSLSLLTINALAATDEVLIPIQCEYFALEGLSQLLKTIDLVKTNIHPELKIGGIIFTMYDSRLILNNEVLEEVKEHFPSLVFETTIPRNVRLSEAPSYGMPILYYDPTSSGSIAYEKLTDELINRIENKRENKDSVLIESEKNLIGEVENSQINNDNTKEEAKCLQPRQQAHQHQNAGLAEVWER